MAGYWLDDYERSARLMPGLLAIAPIVVAALGFGVPAAIWPSSIGAALAVIVGPVLLAKYVRSRGLAREDKLYRRWGAPPTTLLLRPPPSGAGAILAQRRAHVERVTGVELPSHAHNDDPETYQAAILILRSKTGDHARFPTVFAELKGYGFERNLLGIKPEGLVLSGFATLALGVAAIIDALRDTSLNLTSLTIAFVAAALLVIFWTTWPNPRRVRRAGDKYAERLIDAAAAVP